VYRSFGLNHCVNHGLGVISKIFWGARFTGALALAALLGLFAIQMGPVLPAAAVRQAPATLVLDNVALSLSTTFLPNTEFTVSEPGSVSQVATAAAWRPFRELTITAVPFGTRPGTETVPLAGPGAAPAYALALRSVRLAQGGQVTSGPAATLFGQRVIGRASVVNLNVDGPELKPILVVEWVVEAGQRLWIVRASQEQPAGTAGASSATAPSSLSDLVLTSPAPGNPTTIHSVPGTASVPTLPAAPAAGNLPFPAWWQGDCDNQNYSTATQGRSSYRLGAVYLGMPACGPRPYADGAPDVVVHFYPYSWGVLEWECVELSMRYLYLAYGVRPYQANGNTVVWHYSSSADGGTLQKIANGTANSPPQAGDVLSYNGTSSVGHTSVVISSTVDLNGNGTVAVIEQNNTPNGTSTMNVANWYVLGNSGSVSGWLHNVVALPLQMYIPLVQQ
jgi:hypothetical protein